MHQRAATPSQQEVATARALQEMEETRAAAKEARRLELVAKARYAAIVARTRGYTPPGTVPQRARKRRRFKEPVRHCNTCCARWRLPGLPGLTP